jgi:hypothetical protein
MTFRMVGHRRASCAGSRELNDFKGLLECRDTEGLHALAAGGLNAFK